MGRREFVGRRLRRSSSSSRVGVRRNGRNALVNVRGARVYTCRLRAFGQLGYITFGRDAAAMSCAALSFHALPVHVRKGYQKRLLRLRHPRQIAKSEVVSEDV